MSTQDPTRYRLGGFAIPEGLEELHLLLEQVSTAHPDIEPMELMMFETAVTEIANNVVEHGTPPGEVRWQFEIRVSPDRLSATLADNGEAFTGQVESDMPDELDEGGRGLALAGAILDELRYERTDEGNVWHLARATDRRDHQTP
jgi:serine/threonine-protein kinase RsbW